MSDLTDFLLARIAEDEVGEISYTVLMRGTTAERTRIDRETPSPRWLAECKAKRSLVEDWVRADAVCGSYPGTDTGYEMGLAHAVDLAAEVYADHPDYREEWRP